jgi:hypothetical protein
MNGWQVDAAMNSAMLMRCATVIAQKVRGGNMMLSDMKSLLHACTDAMFSLSKGVLVDNANNIPFTFCSERG